MHMMGAGRSLVLIRSRAEIQIMEDPYALSYLNILQLTMRKVSRPRLHIDGTSRIFPIITSYINLTPALVESAWTINNGNGGDAGGRRSYTPTWSETCILGTAYLVGHNLEHHLSSGAAEEARGIGQ